jgi:ABC-2 type transport system ATP-binding protein
MQEAVVIRNLSKRYNEVQALREISLDINKNEIFGFIGPDGAGKTTLFRILNTLLLPDQGEAFVEGFNVVKDFRQIREITGYMPGRFSLYQDLSVEENLRFFASIFKTTLEENYDQIRDIYRHIELFRARPAGKLSGGMKQKLALCCALIHRPQILFLDEPTTGVDAVSRKEFWEMLKKLRAEGITILVSTPYMDEAGQCDRVALIERGHIMSVDTPAAIVDKYEWPLAAVSSDRMYQLLYDLEEWKNTVSAYRFGDKIHVSLRNEKVGTGDIEAWLESKGHGSIHADFIRPIIEDCYMAMMKNN